MTFRIHLLCFVSLIAGCLQVEANRVSSAASREAVLQKARAILDAEPRAFATMPNDRNNPFAAAPLEVTPVEAVGRPAPQERARLDDRQALEAISRSFRPSGSIIVGERRLLRMENGGTIREGEQFTARIHGQSYTVTVSEISLDGYALTLGDVTIHGRFSDAGPAGAITPTTPPPDAEEP